MCQQSTIIYADITDYINGNEKRKICRQIAATAPQVPASGIFFYQIIKIGVKTAIIRTVKKWKR